MGVVGLVLVGLIISLLFFEITSLTGFHRVTATGEHTGYVTAVEKTGLFFITGRAYVKTDTESSQEDAYCVVDDDVLAQLREVSREKKLVTIQFMSWFASGIKYCQGEKAVITGLK